MRYDPIQPGELVSPSQRRVVQSTFQLLDIAQTAWAASKGLNPGELSRMLRGHLVVRDDYAEALNEVVRSAHPVQLAA